MKVRGKRIKKVEKSLKTLGQCVGPSFLVFWLKT